MGRVYRATVRDGGKDVAIKVLRDDLAEQPDVVARFVQERQLLRSVAHPNVVRVHDLVVEGDDLAIVMDLVEGGDLRRAVTGPLDPRAALELLAQVADGLVAVHAAGVVHRDLKPANVLCETRPDGGRTLRLTDFGVSRLVGGGMTQVTSVIGTPGYLAPEVSGGGRATAAADLYALGVMLYELCAGTAPFVAENPLALLIAHATQSPPRPPQTPDRLWDLLQAMMAKDPQVRPTAAQAATYMRELARTFQPLDASSPSPAATPAVAAGPAVAATPAVAAGPAAAAAATPGPATAPAAPDGAPAAAAPLLISADWAKPQAGSWADDETRARVPRSALADTELPARGLEPRSPVPADSGLGSAHTMLRPVAPSAPIPVLGPPTDEPTGRRLPRLAPAWIAASAAAAALLLILGLFAALRLGPFGSSTADTASKATASEGATAGSFPVAATTDAASAGSQGGVTVASSGPSGAAVPNNAAGQGPAPVLPVQQAGVGNGVKNAAGKTAATPTKAPVTTARVVTPTATPTPTVSTPRPSTPIDTPTVSLSPSPVAHAAPGVPTFSIYLPTPSAGLNVDGHAPLYLTGLVPTDGTIKSITIKYSAGTINVPYSSGTSTYYPVVSGLTNGTKYSFTAEVCNSFDMCTNSGTVSFTPYGLPKVGAISGSATGTKVTFMWDAVFMNYNPISFPCTVSITSTPADPAPPASTAVSANTGSLTFTGKSGTAYQAAKTCGGSFYQQTSRSTAVTVS